MHTQPVEEVERSVSKYASSILLNYAIITLKLSELLHGGIHLQCWSRGTLLPVKWICLLFIFHILSHVTYA